MTTKLAASALMGLALICPAHSEPSSIRCTDPHNQPPNYFATFDLEARKLVFETPIGNLFRGEIASANDQRVDFWVKPSIYKIDMVFDRRNIKMIFPGFLTAAEIRPELVHSCQFVSVRTILSRFDAIAKSWPNYTSLGDPVQPRSVSCTGRAALTILTWDRQTKKVIMEIQGGGSYAGEIEDSQDRRVMFSIHDGPANIKRGFVFDDEAKTLIWPHDGAASPDKYPCTEMKVRTLLDAYERP